MIKGEKKLQLSKEAILSKISSYDIYRFYQGPFTVNKVCINRHRGEVTPSLIIGNKLSNDLTHKDFGDYSWRGDCFHFVQQIFKCDFYTALQIIDRDFGLGLGGGKVTKSPIIWEKPKIEMKPPPLLQVVTGKFTKEGWNYWGRYYQGEEDIKRENIFMPKEIWRNKQKMWLGNELTFCYYYEELDKWKIYRPFAPKRTKDTPPHLWKWDTNLPFDYVENLSLIEGAKIGILGKSKKDRMVLRKALELKTIANVQAEDPACLSNEAIRIFDTCERKIIVSDNDKKGKEFSWWLTNNYGFKHCNVPDKYSPLTDFADMAYTFDLQNVTDHFKRKNII